MLTKEQQAAVESPHKDTVVIAGAGAGKTRVLIERVKWMLSQGIEPETIVLITFTRKAANEIRERLALEYGVCPKVRLGTFHSLALEFLRDKQPTVIGEYVIDDIVRRANRAVLMPVSRERIDAYRFARALGTLRDNPDIRRAVAVYEGILRNENSTDFLGMLIDGIAVAGKLDGFHVLVDEAQDTDDLQWLFVSKLRKGKTLFAVGDIRQQLYLWRNVNEKTFWLMPGERYYLTGTFRYGRTLARMTNEMAHRSGYRGPEVMPFDPNAESQIYYSPLWDVEEVMARFTGSMQKDDSVAVLCRYNSQVDWHKDELAHLGITVGEPVKVNHSEMIALMQYLSSPWNESLRRAFLSHPASEKLLPQLCALSTESSARYIESWLGKDSTINDIFRGVETDQVCKESQEWWKNKYGTWGVADALSDYVTSDEDEDYTPGVRVMTVHASKGLEFEHVFFPLAPTRKFSTDEWRVAYVACTRAKKSLYVSGADNPIADVVSAFAAQSAAISK